MECKICGDPVPAESINKLDLCKVKYSLCGWCEYWVSRFVEGMANHSVINISWGAGKISWQDAYGLRDFIKENNIKEVLEFGTGLSTEIFAILGLKIVTCDTLKNHSHLFSQYLSLKGIADIHFYDPDPTAPLTDFAKLYPGKQWEFVFVDGGQGRDRETEAALKLSSKWIFLHDPGLSKFKLELPGFEQINGSFLFKKKGE